MVHTLSGWPSSTGVVKHVKFFMWPKDACTAGGENPFLRDEPDCITFAREAACLQVERVQGGRDFSRGEDDRICRRRKIDA